MIRDIIEKNRDVKSNSREIGLLHRDFPQCFNKEGKFDIEKFKQLIGDGTEIIAEGYDLIFLGKQYAKLNASTDTTTVIVPDTEQNEQPENKNSQNIYISGDNIDALKHFLKSYNKQVKCIYIDPPYNTGSDGFVYNDQFNYKAEELAEKLSISEEKAARILSFTKKGSASHSAWLTFMASRLLLAKDLLTDDGVIFISIDDNEQANLKLLCDSVFGEENFVATFPWRKRTAKSDVPFGVSQDFEWVLCYANSENAMASIEGKERKYYETEDFPNRPWRFHDMTTQRSALERPNCFFTIVNPKNGVEYPPNPNRVWANNEETFQEFYKNNRIIFPGDYDFMNITKPVLRYWKDDDEQKAGDSFGTIAISTNLPKEVGMSQDGTKDIDALFSSKIFSFPKPVSLLKYLVSSITSDSDLILDFFSGSGTTAHAVMKLNAEDGGNRKYIMVQKQEKVKKGSEAEKAGYKTIDEIGQERIRRAGKKIRGGMEAEIDQLKAELEMKREKREEERRQLKLIEEKSALDEEIAQLESQLTEKESRLAGMDFGFKHFTLKEPKEHTLDKMETFDANGLMGDESIQKEFGNETVLATWMNADGYGLNAQAEAVKLDAYTAYLCGRHLYFLDGGLTEKDVVKLVERYGDEVGFNAPNWVVFGYSFSFSEMETLRKNAVPLEEGRKNIKVNIITRY